MVNSSVRKYGLDLCICDSRPNTTNRLTLYAFMPKSVQGSLLSSPLTIKSSPAGLKLSRVAKRLSCIMTFFLADNGSTCIHSGYCLRNALKSRNSVLDAFAIWIAFIVTTKSITLQFISDTSRRSFIKPVPISRPTLLSPFSHPKWLLSSPALIAPHSSSMTSRKAGWLSLTATVITYWLVAKFLSFEQQHALLTVQKDESQNGSDLESHYPAGSQRRTFSCRPTRFRTSNVAQA